MSLGNFSKFVRRDIDNAKHLDAETATSIAGDNFIDLVLTGSLNEDINIVKEVEGPRSGGLLPLRLINGRLVSAFTLQNLLTVKMRAIATKKMGTGGRLVYRTGRLINSSSVEPQIVNIGNNVSLQFRYMFSPYEVFDPSVSTYNGLSSANRNPRRLFTESLKEAAKEVLFRGYNITVAQVGVT